MRRLLAAIVLVAAAQAAVAATPVAPTLDSVHDVLEAQVGSWDCAIVYPGRHDVEKFVVVWSEFGDNAIRGSVDVPAFISSPAHKASFSLAYDAAKKEWIDIFTDSLGSYSISKSLPGSSATRLAFARAYPPDGTLLPSLLVLGEQTTTLDSRWMVSGTLRFSHEICEKMSG